MTTKSKNVNRATTVGATAGGAGAAVITWGSTVVEQKYGVPAAVSAAVFGSVFAFLARWAAKLSPQE